MLCTYVHTYIHIHDMIFKHVLFAHGVCVPPPGEKRGEGGVGGVGVGVGVGGG